MVDIARLIAVPHLPGSIAIVVKLFDLRVDIEHLLACLVDGVDGIAEFSHDGHTVAKSIAPTVFLQLYHKFSCLVDIAFLELVFVSIGDDFRRVGKSLVEVRHRVIFAGESAFARLVDIPEPLMFAIHHNAAEPLVEVVGTALRRPFKLAGNHQLACGVDETYFVCLFRHPAHSVAELTYIVELARNHHFARLVLEAYQAVLPHRTQPVVVASETLRPEQFLARSVHVDVVVALEHGDDTIAELLNGTVVFEGNHRAPFLVDVAHLAVFLHAGQPVSETPQVLTTLDGFGEGFKVVVVIFCCGLVFLSSFRVHSSAVGDVATLSRALALLIPACREHQQDRYKQNNLFHVFNYLSSTFTF